VIARWKHDRDAAALVGEVGGGPDIGGTLLDGAPDDRARRGRRLEDAPSRERVPNLPGPSLTCRFVRRGGRI
jgi:hypothetical protein